MGKRTAYAIVAWLAFIAILNLLPAEWGYAAGVWTRERLNLAARMME